MRRFIRLLLAVLRDERPFLSRDEAEDLASICGFCAGLIAIILVVAVAFVLDRILP